MHLLEVKDLHVKRGDALILKGLSLHVRKGEICALMGPNGSGKSTLSAVIAGHPDYKIISGDILFMGKSILALSPSERAKLGMFLVFQSPRAIDGVHLNDYLYTIYKNALVDRLGMTEKEIKSSKEHKKSISLAAFKMRLASKMAHLRLESSALSGSLNVGLSGGEKKKLEVIQMGILNPSFSILDELDSGLDVDALKIVCGEISDISKETGMGMLIITHHLKVFEYLNPEKVFVLKDGVVTDEGDVSLARKLDEEGFFGDLKS